MTGKREPRWAHRLIPPPGADPAAAEVRAARSPRVPNRRPGPGPAAKILAIDRPKEDDACGSSSGLPCATMARGCRCGAAPRGPWPCSLAAKKVRPDSFFGPLMMPAIDRQGVLRGACWEGPREWPRKIVFLRRRGANHHGSGRGVPRVGARNVCNRQGRWGVATPAATGTVQRLLGRGPSRRLLLGLCRSPPANRRGWERPARDISGFPSQQATSKNSLAGPWRAFIHCPRGFQGRTSRRQRAKAPGPRRALRKRPPTSWFAPGTRWMSRQHSSLFVSSMARIFRAGQGGDGGGNFFGDPAARTLGAAGVPRRAAGMRTMRPGGLPFPVMLSAPFEPFAARG